ncbi:MAG TPA: AgmX/PglI C-terminal domain-containing protein [Gemmatimonadaceae bacterium]|nr:AgmX/PglI C-terminal domain-containing protein [Gemmatimonadaceae bacterium]
MTASEDPRRSGASAPPPKRRTGRVRAPVDETSFTRELRHELASDEGRALLVSSGISAGIGVLWLFLVLFGPRTETAHLLSAEERPINVTFEAPPPDLPKTPPTPAAPVAAAKPVAKPAAAAPKPSGPTLAEKRNAAAAAAFGAPAASNGPVGDVSNVLRGVSVASNSPATPGAATGGKQVLAYGQGGAGSRTPGRDAGGGSGTGSIGAVEGTGGFGAQAVRIGAPKAIGAPSLGGPGRDVGELGTQVRDHESQLRFCYNEFGLKVNPSLAGSVVISLTLTESGAVTNAQITSRTWSGPGADAAEQCILQRARAWKFSPSASGAGTFEFNFSFTK